MRPALVNADGGLRHRADLFEPDRPRQDRAARIAAGGCAYLRRRGAVLSHLLHLRRRADRGVWLRTRSPRDLGRVRGAHLRERDGLGGHQPAAHTDRAQQRDAAAGARDRLRQHVAHRRGVDRGVLGRRLRQRVRACTHEGLDAGPLAVDAHHRLDDRRIHRLRAADGISDSHDGLWSRRFQILRLPARRAERHQRGRRGRGALRGLHDHDGRGLARDHRGGGGEIREDFFLRIELQQRPHGDGILGHVVAIVHQMLDRPLQRRRGASHVQRGLFDADSFEMLEGVLAVGELKVRDIMIARSMMAVVARDDDPKELLQAVVESGHSRFPVTGEDRDEIVGILLAKDLLRYYAGEEEFNVRDMLRPAVVSAVVDTT